ncbi:Uncharacterised protein g11425 [Pycnogonum litorale]
MYSPCIHSNGIRKQIAMLTLASYKGWPYYVFIVLAEIVALSLQDTCTIRLLTSPYSDCENTYWKNVTFILFGTGNDEFVSPVMDVCNPGAISVFVNNIGPISKGNIGLIQNDAGGQFTSPDFREWHLEQIVINCEQLSSEVKFGIGRKVESGRIYRYVNHDTTLYDTSHLLHDEQRSHEIAVKRVEYTQSRILGVGPYAVSEPCS